MRKTARKLVREIVGGFSETNFRESFVAMWRAVEEGLINPLPQIAAASVTTRGHSPRHNNHNPGKASNSPRITKKIAIVSAINIANSSRHFN